MLPLYEWRCRCLLRRLTRKRSRAFLCFQFSKRLCPTVARSSVMLQRKAGKRLMPPTARRTRSGPANRRSFWDPRRNVPLR